MFSGEDIIHRRKIINHKSCINSRVYAIERYKEIIFCVNQFMLPLGEGESGVVYLANNFGRKEIFQIYKNTPETAAYL